MEAVGSENPVSGTVRALVHGPSRESRLFESALLPSFRCWRALFVSSALHCAFILLLPTLLSLIPEDEEKGWRRHAFVIRPLELQVDERLYLPASSPAPPKPEGAKPRGEVRKQDRLANSDRKPPGPAKLAKPAPRRFELPQLARKMDVQQTILQPQFPPDMPLERQIRLPNVVFWSAQARLPKPAPRRFVQPGRDPSTAAAVPDLDAPPRLEPPSRELTVSSLKISGPSFSDNPKLPMLRGTTVPVRVFRPPTPDASAGASLDAYIGEPMNLLALSSSPAPPERVLRVPAGNQLGQLPAPPDEAGTGGGEAGAEKGQAGTGERVAGEVGGAAHGAGSGGPPVRGGQRGGSGTGSGSGSGTGGSGSGSSGPGSGGGGPGARGAGGTSTGGIGTGGGRLLALGAPPSGLPASVPIGITQPINAVADIVVLSSSSGVSPDATTLLSGKPVFTVYLALATRKEWTLQYCKPTSVAQGAQAQDRVVQLGSAAPIKAPYLVVRRTPPITMEPRATSILVHGLLDVTGRFKDLALVRETDSPLREEILPYLQEWEFRPGTQDGRPVLLEILLVIPPNRG